MQKRMIALSVAGLVSGAAFAQSNVTVFGIMDAGYQYSWDNQQSNVKKQGKVIAGGVDGSRVGFRGTEDLGNGLKANFELVANFDGDTGVNGGTLMGEGAWVGFSGDKWGEIRAGYTASFLDENTGIDVSGRHGIASTGALYGTGKYKNFVAYYSPVWSGFQVKAGYSSNVVGQDATPFPGVFTPLNVRAYTAAASYANGGLKLGAAYAAYQPMEVNSGLNTKNGSEWNAGISYDFKVVAVSLFGARNKNGENYAVGLNDGLFEGADHRNFMALGLAVPIGAKDVIKLGYGKAKTYESNSNNKDDSTAWGVVYLHSLSKRTTAYAMYGNVNSDNDLYSVKDGYQQAINFGVKHTF